MLGHLALGQTTLNNTIYTYYNRYLHDSTAVSTCIYYTILKLFTLISEKESESILIFAFPVLSSGAHGGAHHVNSTTQSVEETRLRSCGSNFCVIGGNAGNLERPPDSEIYHISAIYLSCIVVATIMIALMVDPLSR